jgi:uncharacterized protein (TIGR02145 family)
MTMDNRKWLSIIVALIFLFSGCEKGYYTDTFAVHNPGIAYGSVTDQEGNTYKTILIGTQTWMVRNLKTTRFNDGTPIPVVTDSAAWNNLSTPGCCWQQNDPIRRVTYGVLYNWHTVNTDKLCPTGWHVPSDAEWSELTEYLGGENIAGGKLKETGFRHWISPNTGATDESHFSAFPGGKRLDGPDALFKDLGEAGYWWTASSGEEWAVIRSLDYNSFQIQKLFYPKQVGLSVRCIRDY